MGRPSKLTEVQWEKLHNRLLSGEKAADLAKEYGLSKAMVSKRFSKLTVPIKDLAKQIVETETSISKLTISEQKAVFTLADSLKAISHNLAGGAEHGSFTFLRMAGVVRKLSEKVNSADPMESQETLQAMAACTKIANDAAAPGLALLNSNKDANKQPDGAITVIRDYGIVKVD